MCDTFVSDGYIMCFDILVSLEVVYVKVFVLFV